MAAVAALRAAPATTCSPAEGAAPLLRSKLRCQAADSSKHSKLTPNGEDRESGTKHNHCRSLWTGKMSTPQPPVVERDTKGRAMTCHSCFSWAGRCHMSTSSSPTTYKTARMEGTSLDVSARPGSSRAHQRQVDERLSDGGRC